MWGCYSKIPKPLGFSKNEEEAKEMDWQMVDIPPFNKNLTLTRCIEITIKKRIPADLIKGFWWERAFEGGEEASIKKKHIPGSRSSKFIDAWEQAQKDFIESKNLNTEKLVRH